MTNLRMLQYINKKNYGSKKWGMWDAILIVNQRELRTSTKLSGDCPNVKLRFLCYRPCKSFSERKEQHIQIGCLTKYTEALPREL